jgi:hypothetical protein
MEFLKKTGKFVSRSNYFFPAFFFKFKWIVSISTFVGIATLALVGINIRIGGLSKRYESVFVFENLIIILGALLVISLLLHVYFLMKKVVPSIQNGEYYTGLFKRTKDMSEDFQKDFDFVRNSKTLLGASFAYAIASNYNVTSSSMDVASFHIFQVGQQLGIIFVFYFVEVLWMYLLALLSQRKYCETEPWWRIFPLSSLIIFGTFSGFWLAINLIKSMTATSILVILLSGLTFLAFFWISKFSLPEKKHKILRFFTLGPLVLYGLMFFIVVHPTASQSLNLSHVLAYFLYFCSAVAIGVVAARMMCAYIHERKQ